MPFVFALFRAGLSPLRRPWSLSPYMYPPSSAFIPAQSVREHPAGVNGKTLVFIEEIGCPLSIVGRPRSCGCARTRTVYVGPGSLRRGSHRGWDGRRSEKCAEKPDVAVDVRPMLG